MSFWNDVLYPVIGEAVPWIVVLGLPVALVKARDCWLYRKARRFDA